MRIAIDTNLYRDFFSADSEVQKQLRVPELIYVPFVTLAELRAGFLCGSRGRENEHGLEQFLSTPRVRTLHQTDRTSRFYAQLYYQLRSLGTPIPTNDLWIASLVMENDIYLYSGDQHFDCLPQLPRF